MIEITPNQEDTMPTQTTQTPGPWTADYDPCDGKDPMTGKTYGKDWPLTANVKGMSLDGDGDYKPCFARVRFSTAIPLDEQKTAARLIAAAPEMLEALKRIESCLAPDDNDVATQAVRRAIVKAEGG
jgi:hypothetical protein